MKSALWCAKWIICTQLQLNTAHIHQYMPFNDNEKRVQTVVYTRVYQMKPLKMRDSASGPGGIDDHPKEHLLFHIREGKKRESV